jgi:acylphosphatase
MVKTLRLIVRGKVQGVGFRYFAKDKALELQITGWVRNLPDRTVEILAQGPGETLERFMQSIEIGPLGSRVEKVESQWIPDEKDQRRFEIIG